MIKVVDMVKQMRLTVGLGKPKPFSCIYVTADRKRKKGGQFRELHKAVLLTRKRTPNRMLLLQPLGTKNPILVSLDLIIYFNGQPVS
ncbi:hypothetical protein G8759_20030 [Spirosoma aureum]|uniref:Uncharacterized protein n=1 Tax=Spirosoma aureum TaxID=2692134 RepID=A0A6G9AQH8_9BACT|nr:hypothetical protein [Spirosoma aureum]QIP14741.1 hypothetical protein G8759_20030 [Spirosoma aureum]